MDKHISKSNNVLICQRALYTHANIYITEFLGPVHYR